MSKYFCKIHNQTMIKVGETSLYGIKSGELYYCTDTDHLKVYPTESFKESFKKHPVIL